MSLINFNNEKPPLKICHRYFCQLAVIWEERKMLQEKRLEEEERLREEAEIQRKKNIRKREQHVASQRRKQQG